MTTVETPLSPVKKILEDQNIITKARAQSRLLITFDNDSYRAFINVEELRAKIVDLNAEGVPKWKAWFNKALKIDLKPGEVKYLKIYVPGGHYTCSILTVVYTTGTAYMQAGTVNYWFYQSNFKLTNTWWFVTTHTLAHDNGIALFILYGGDMGGSIYITLIHVLDRNLDNPALAAFSADNLSFSGNSETITLHVPYPPDLAYLMVDCFISGDGTNALNVAISLNTPAGTKQIASFSTTSATKAWYYVTIPFRFYNNKDFKRFTVTIHISGYGVFERFYVFVMRGEYRGELTGLKTASASNTSTTVTSYTLIDTNGRANRYKQASVSLSSPSGGTAKLYINGVLVADYSGSSGTFNIPDDIDIYEISVELAGNGTTAATANFSGLEIKGPYLVRG